MDRRIVRIMAGAIALLICMPASLLTGCNKTKKGGRASDLPSEITADMPWYESEVTYVTNDIDPYVHELTEKYILGVASDTIVARTKAYKIMSFLDDSDARTEPFAERNNRWYQALSTLYQPSQLAQYGYAQAMIDPDLLQLQIDGYIESAAGIRMMDAPVEIIVREEIQAYFAGQKTIEQTMELIQNRVDTFVNERG